jgi:hypothetical protein
MEKGKLSLQEALQLGKEAPLKTKSDIKRTGRNKIDETVKATEFVKVYFTKDEKVALKQAAGKMPLSIFVNSKLSDLGLLGR